MDEQGKYHRQRLKAKDVLRLYAAGERDFRGTILRGCNFRGADLSGADFSGADIRSARFVDATLQGAKFCQAQAGLQRRWWLGQTTIGLIITALAGLLQGSAGGLLGGFLAQPEIFPIAIGVGGIILVITALVVFICQGFTFRTLWSITIAVAIAGAAAGTVAFTIYAAGVGTDASPVSRPGNEVGVVIAGAVAGAVTFGVTLAIAIVFVGAVAITIAFVSAIGIAAAGVFAGISASAVIFLGGSDDIFFETGAVTGAVAIVVASLLVSIYISRRVHRSGPRLKSLRIIGLAFAGTGGTTFSGANLAGATFAHARLKSTNFADSRQHPTTLTQVRWHDAQKLDLARLGSSILQDHRVRFLLTTLSGIDQDLSNADLRSAHLADAQLHRANLQSANLNGAILWGAELQGANLTEASCLNTDFTGADLTGACVEAWNIDSTTCLEAVHCNYIFLHRNEEERRPSSGIFQHGEFTKLFQEVLSTIDLIFQNGVDWQAFTRTLNQVQTQHEAADLSVQSIANKGDGVVVVKLNAAPDVDKSAIHQTFMEGYQVALKEAEARYKAQLEAKDEQITILSRKKCRDERHYRNPGQPTD